MTITCLVDTCAEAIAVNLYKGNQQVGTLTTENSDQRAFDFEITVDENSVGQYACSADVWGSRLGAASAMSEFEVIGKFDTHFGYLQYE